MDIMGSAEASGYFLNAGAGAVLNRTREERAAERAKAAREAMSAARTGEEDPDPKLRGVAGEFVSMFMNMVVKSMRANVPQNQEFHGDNGEKFFQDLLDAEYSKSLAGGSGYGLTDLVYESLLAKTRFGAPPAGDDAGGAADEPGAEAIAPVP